MASKELLAEIALQKRLHEWMGGLEKRISTERRFKVLTALRRELERCHEDAKIIEDRITRLETESESESQAS